MGLGRGALFLRRSRVLPRALHPLGAPAALGRRPRGLRRRVSQPLRSAHPPAPRGNPREGRSDSPSSQPARLHGAHPLPPVRLRAALPPLRHRSHPAQRAGCCRTSSSGIQLSMHANSASFHRASTRTTDGRTRSKRSSKYRRACAEVYDGTAALMTSASSPKRVCN